MSRANLGCDRDRETLDEIDKDLVGSSSCRVLSDCKTDWSIRCDARLSGQ